MACDVKKLMSNLRATHNFEGKKILWVGAGVGQIAQYLRGAAKIFAVDNDAKTLTVLAENIAKLGLTKLFELINGDFYDLALTADVVLFDFCLHEMADPMLAIARAKGLAPDIVVLDHWPGSEWAYLANEELKVKKSWAAINSFALKKKRQLMTEQFFESYQELQNKLASQGPVSMKRILKYVGRTGIIIPMTYGIAVL